MKTKVIIILLLISANFYSQTFTTNRTPVGMEHNVLFNAEKRYNVQTKGTAKHNLSALFDGSMLVNYGNVPIPDGVPTEILISGLPKIHTQAGAWVGWSTRYWPAKRFKILGHNTYQNKNVWNVLADYSTTDYKSAGSFHTKVSKPGMYTELKFIFYSSHGSRLGLSELFFIHPEGTTPYKGLLSSVQDESWAKSDNDISYTKGKVGIGTDEPVGNLHVKGGSSPSIRLTESQTNAGLQFGIATNNGGYNRFSRTKDAILRVLGGGDLIFSIPGTGSNRKIAFHTEGDKILTIQEVGESGKVGVGTTNFPLAIGDTDLSNYKLFVGGGILTDEVRVQTNWADFVFLEDYNLPTIQEVETHIKEKGHLKDIPSAKEVEENGISLGEMNSKLLQKIEELTLYTIQQQKEITQLKEQKQELEQLKLKFKQLEKLINKK